MGQASHALGLVERHVAHNWLVGTAVELGATRGIRKHDSTVGVLIHAVPLAYVSKAVKTRLDPGQMSQQGLAPSETATSSVHDCRQ